MFILKTGHQPGVYVPLRALFLVFLRRNKIRRHFFLNCLRFASISHKDSTLIKVKFCYVHLK